jgi:hypothetical protein
MKNLFEISQEEKNRILNIHESATKNQYLISEQQNSDSNWSKYPCVTSYPSAKKIPLSDGTTSYNIGKETYYNTGRKTSYQNNGQTVNYSCDSKSLDFDKRFGDNAKSFKCASKASGAQLVVNAEPNIDAYKIGETFFDSQGFKYTPGSGGKLNYDCNDPLLKGEKVQGSPEQKQKGYTVSPDIIKKLQDEIVKYDPNYKPTGTLDQTTLDALNKLIS